MIPEAKRLVPGIHMLGQRMAWEDSIPRSISTEEAETIALKVWDVPNVFVDLSTIRAEIEEITGVRSVT